MRNLRKIIIIGVILTVSTNLYSRSIIVETNCPLCDTVVAYRQHISFSVFTNGLDLQPIGSVLFPLPIPRCENCGFVFIEDFFTDYEIIILRNYIIEQNIFYGKENFPDNYFLAFVLQLLETRDNGEVAHFFISSVWEYSFIKMAVQYIEENEIENTNGINFDMSTYIFLKQNAIEKINAVDTNFETYYEMQLVKLDFMRRLGLFDEAKSIINYIRSSQNFYKGIVVDIIRYQTVLIGRNDRNQHFLDHIDL